MSQQPQAPSAPAASGVIEGSRTWRDGICECFKNLWPSCCCVFVNYGGILPMFYAGQISSRLGYFKTWPLMIVYVSLFIICSIVSIAGAASHNPNWDAVWIIPSIFILVFLVMLRFRFVHHFSLNEQGLSTCCIGFWCAPCSLCQMGRHLYGYTKLFDGDGDPEGNMSYNNESAVITSAV